MPGNTLSSPLPFCSLQQEGEANEVGGAEGFLHPVQERIPGKFSAGSQLRRFCLILVQDGFLGTFSLLLSILTSPFCFCKLNLEVKRTMQATAKSRPGRMLIPGLKKQLHYSSIALPAFRRASGAGLSQQQLGYKASLNFHSSFPVCF